MVKHGGGNELVMVTVEAAAVGNPEFIDHNESKSVQAFVKKKFASTYRHLRPATPLDLSTE